MSAADTLETAVGTLEARATAVEAALAQLQQQATHNDNKCSSSSSSNTVALTQRLQELLKCMHEDRDECEHIRAQRDELREENERLRQQVSKHEYRIQHLLRTIDELEVKSAMAVSAAAAATSDDTTTRMCA